MAIMSGAKIGIGIGAIEVYPCDACLVKIKQEDWNNTCSARAKKTWQTQTVEQVIVDKVPEQCVESEVDNKELEVSCEEHQHITRRASL
ncbi:hypothetical protein ACF0H5_021755 [Mactra antiquata]